MIENYKKYNNIEVENTIYYLRDNDGETDDSNDKKKKCCSICRVF
jgi:hypothetical protein